MSDIEEHKTCKQCGKEFAPVSWAKRDGLCSYDCDKKAEEESRKRYLAKSKMLSDIINPIPYTNYCVDQEFTELRGTFNRYAKSYGGFEYNPDFQRGNVWTLDKQIGFIEAIVKRKISKQGLTITLNCPNFNEDQPEDSDLKGFCIVDGLQRVTAINDFLDGKFKIFDDKLTMQDLNGSEFSLRRQTLKVQVFSFAYKRDLLKYYIDINTGGVVHSDEEIDRVQVMLDGLK